MPDTSDILGVNSRCLVQVYVARKNESIPPPWGRKKTVRPPPLMQVRLSHDGPWFCVSVMNLLYS